MGNRAEKEVVRSNVRAQVVDYYAEGGPSTIFHDLLAAVEPGCKDDVTFYASLLRTSPARILELGCGSGRVSLALAKRGHSVAGIDISKAMLARAMFQRACLDDLTGSSSRLNFTVGDMTSFSFPTQFDLIIAPYFAINHLPTRRAVMKTFVRVAEHLVPGAILPYISQMFRDLHGPLRTKQHPRRFSSMIRRAANSV